jgi:hypothetical protein
MNGQGLLHASALNADLGQPHTTLTRLYGGALMRRRR